MLKDMFTQTGEGTGGGGGGGLINRQSISRCCEDNALGVRTTAFPQEEEDSTDLASDADTRRGRDPGGQAALYPDIQTCRVPVVWRR